MMTSGDASRIWKKTCNEYIQPEIGALTYETWFKPAKPLLGDGSGFILSVPNELSKNFLESYSSLIENALRLATARDWELSVEVNAEERRRESLEDLQKNRIKAMSDREWDSGLLDPNLTFEHFVVGPSNHFAYAACVAVASMQNSRNYNPLFLYGGSGLGKTHLMHAIGNEVLQKFPEKRVVYVKTERFVNEFIQVIQNKHYEDFRAKYRQADLLLIDDIQFIEKKEQMQEEFFHTFNALSESGKNIVLTCDKAPQALTTLADRLQTRIASGLTIDITPPDYEMRMAILANLCQQYQLNLSDDIMDYVASHITSNIRVLEGAFKTLLAYERLSDHFGLEEARAALKNLVSPGAVTPIDAPLIMNVTANYFDVSVEDLKSKKRKKELVEARHVAMYLCYQLINMTYTDIGEVFGGKNHATVIHACNRMMNDLDNDPKLRHQVNEIQQRLKP